MRFFMCWDSVRVLFTIRANHGRLKILWEADVNLIKDMAIAVVIAFF